jgi:DNA-binding GntR family transcriptional regulator
MLSSPRPADRHAVESAEQIVAALRSCNLEDAQRAMRTHLLIDRPPEGRASSSLWMMARSANAIT